MSTQTRDLFDRVMDEHWAAEAAHDIEAVMATITDDAEQDLVGSPAHPLRGKEQIRAFYEQLFQLIDQEEQRTVRRYYGDDHLVEEAIWTGTFDGVLVGVEGKRGRVSFRILHVIEVRDGRISRENAWLDVDAIREQLLSAEA